VFSGFQRIAAAAVLLICAAGRLGAAEEGQLDASRSLFSILAAINAAGYDADLDSPANHPLRAQIRRELASRNIPCLNELRTFFENHRQSDWTAELSQYVSFALVVDGPPNFAYRLKRNEIPPDVTALGGFQALMVRFHREAGLDALWQQAQPEFDAAIARYHAPVTRAVSAVSGYLRMEATGFSGWRFQVYVDLLGAPHQIQTRTYANETFVVVTPSPEPQVNDVRQAYLHFLLDPLATRHADEIMKKRAVGDYALAAPFLDEMFKSDFLMLAGESLIKAVESRLEPGPPAAKQAVVNQALSEGYILVPHFAEALAKFETQDVGIRLYYPELITSIDFRKEEKRLANYEFSQIRPVRKVREVTRPKPPEPSAAERTLDEAEKLFDAKQYAKAREAFLRLSKEATDPIMQARALFGLGRVAALDKNPALAEKLFLEVLESSPDPQTAAVTHLYLGRLLDLAGEHEDAAAHYQAAVDTQGASASVREAARKGLEEGFKRQ
jgi:tetratricopeptide (TPR) repeat protein